MDSSDVPEIRIRKSSETPSLGSMGENTQAPMASFETLTDVEESDISDAGTEKHSDGEEVFSEHSQNGGVTGNISGDSGIPYADISKPTSLDIHSDEGADSDTTPTASPRHSPSRPDRPPSPMLSPSRSRPPRPASPSKGPGRPPSPARSVSPGRAPSPARPPPPSKVAKTPDEFSSKPSRPPPPGYGGHSDQELEDTDETYLDRKYGKDAMDSKSTERPRSTTPINMATLDDYVGEEAHEDQEESEKMTISVPGLKRFKKKKEKEKEQKAKEETAEAFMESEFSRKQPQLFSKSPVHGGFQAAPVVEAAPQSATASWTTFGDDDDEPAFQPAPQKKAPPKRPPGPARPPPPKMSARRSIDAGEGDGSTKMGAGSRRTSAPAGR